MTRVATEVFTYERTGITPIYTKKKPKILYFSSKQGFEEKYISEKVIMKFIGTRTLFNLLMPLMIVIGHFEELFDETLDLMKLKP